jgi:hypothetical protein
MLGPVGHEQERLGEDADLLGPAALDGGPEPALRRLAGPDGADAPLLQFALDRLGDARLAAPVDALEGDELAAHREGNALPVIYTYLREIIITARPFSFPRQGAGVV